jgi:fatty acid-binding protein DegV
MTDSTCDIPLEWRTQYEITVIPLTIVLEKNYTGTG